MENYEIIVAGTPQELQKKINDYLRTGYILSGGPSMIQGSKDRWNRYEWESYSNMGTGHVTVQFMQAVYKEKVKVIEVIEEKKVYFNS